MVYLTDQRQSNIGMFNMRQTAMVKCYLTEIDTTLNFKKTFYSLKEKCCDQWLSL